ncbi:hypothetical protein GGI25_006314 [Coemansia spiralis]|uniref:Uncharacterized protein n=2 Tax=Coemansia TaxID=4863 RepID=A0A9W8KUX3_9FUNG|nr:hypothetical protein EDC05_006287 [Coemansia umbellata]KAJ2618767.1 hypothetical protein GGI26_006368 [Coemansia sp. RSA 1358]KAJ2668900.1 hypothetical protein GGI25_006314 [Coemansia spiralis]
MDTRPKSSKAQDIPPPSKFRKTNDSRTQEQKILESGSPTERLLARSPNYTACCELYPKALRDTINENPDGAILAKRDPKVTQQAEKLHRERIRRETENSMMFPEQEIYFYPSVARRNTIGTNK